MVLSRVSESAGPRSLQPADDERPTIQDGLRVFSLDYALPVDARNAPRAAPTVTPDGRRDRATSAERIVTRRRAWAHDRRGQFEDLIFRVKESRQWRIGKWCGRSSV